MVIAQVTWLIATGLVGVMFIASVPTYVAFLHTVASGIVVDLTGGQLSQNGVRSLHELHPSVDFYVGYHILLNALFASGFLLMSGLLFWRKPDDRMAVFTSFVLVTAPFGIMFQPITLASAWSLLVQGITFLSSVGLGLFFYLFPSGSFVPSWTRWLLIGWVLHEGMTDFLPFPTLALFANGLLFVLLTSLIVAQVYRYRSVSSALERQQTRWVVFGCTVAILGFLGVIIPGTFFSAFFQPGTRAYFVSATALTLFLLCIPLSLGVAILRYHLWDIDLIINRTLVYGLLAASVIGSYVPVVGYLSAFFRASNNLFISLLATALIAVLFQPLREGLQRAVNRFLYGQRELLLKRQNAQVLCVLPPIRQGESTSNPPHIFSPCVLYHSSDFCMVSTCSY
jgi:hypothetical protein